MGELLSILLPKLPTRDYFTKGQPYSCFHNCIVTLVGLEIVDEL